ncbi:type 1 glutamine amidotransferase domain-containing protein [Streptomyces sp. NPDC058439]|uniref:type 1 glutamine amidotransferase domain-containing protein n=1 Tax=Streptomyces sp. NPDC058439 TaxID=3346500 RepID=UPI00364C2301
MLKDGTRHATGYRAGEFANPYEILTDAGHGVVVATPNGVTPTVDMMSLRPEMVGGNDSALELEAIIRSTEVMRRPLQLSDVRLEDYDAVYLPGGHGPMADLAWDTDMGRLLTRQLASGNALFIVCHGPAAVLATRIHGESPFKGYNITCFTDEEEDGVGLASRAPWLLETTPSCRNPPPMEQQHRHRNDLTSSNALPIKNYSCRVHLLQVIPRAERGLPSSSCDQFFVVTLRFSITCMSY